MPSSLCSGFISSSPSLRAVESFSVTWSLVWGSCVETGSKTTTGPARCSWPKLSLLGPVLLRGLEEEQLHKTIKNRENIWLSYSWTQTKKKKNPNALSLINMHKVVFEVPAIKRKKELLDDIRSARPEERRRKKSEQLTMEVLKSQTHLPVNYTLLKKCKAPGCRAGLPAATQTPVPPSLTQEPLSPTPTPCTSLATPGGRLAPSEGSHPRRGGRAERCSCQDGQEENWSGQERLREEWGRWQNPGNKLKCSVTINSF